MIKLIPPNCDLTALATGNRQLIRLRAESDWKCDQPAVPERPTVLVIGANGFVGAHLVHSLVQDSRVAEIICLVRPQADRTPIERVMDTLREYGLELTDQQSHRIQYIAGRYTETGLGLTEAGYSEIAERVDVVYHVAGTTDYQVPYEELREEYVLSLLELLRMCAVSPQKQLHYLSSTIRCMFQSPADFDEFSWWYSGYARMKWVNSEILLRAHSGFGVPAYVYDAPYIVGTTDRGQDPGLVYSFWRAVVACALLGQIWDGGFLQFVPVDLLCRAMIANTFSPDPQAVVTPTIDTLWNRDVADELGCQVIEPTAFFRHAQVTVAPKRRRMFEGVSYSDILKAACPDRIGEVIGTEGLPAAKDVFLRGFRQPSIQAALQRASS